MLKEGRGESRRESSKSRGEPRSLNKFFSGIKEMSELPSVLFVVDIHRENIAVAEAKKLGIPVVGMVDTNSNPEEIEYPIPSNDDGLRSIQIITDLVTDSIISGQEISRKRQEDQLAEEAELERQEQEARNKAQAEASKRQTKKAEEKVEEKAPKVEEKVEEKAPKAEEKAPKAEEKVEEEKVEEKAPKAEEKVEEKAPKAEEKVEEKAPKAEEKAKSKTKTSKKAKTDSSTKEEDSEK